MSEGNADSGFRQHEISSIEPGIVRVPSGRIISTGWPQTSHKLWPIAYKELGRHVAEQVKFELDLRKHVTRSEISGAYSITIDGQRTTFNLNNQTLNQSLREELDKKMQHRVQSETIEVCDMGGGAGTLLGFVCMDYKDRKYGSKREQAAFLRTTLTTLVRHDSDVLRRQWGYVIDEIKTMAVELPSDNYYGRFDIISAQNSVFFWSDHPELATLNLWKMLKKNGIVIATIPPVARKINGEPFDIKQYLQSGPLFKFEALGKNQDGSISIRLKRNER